ncbi:eukaryotic translation initiation factor 1-SUI1 [Tribonema minus]|uniref:Eukaryotic translation initiation factor 1-SUI1 n=1 Tax=Tribonema minus TaxID=303371 RepID=A0A835YZC5_9STRA|nr:eukaryotic translation initiation factor 1-SUI1 [Tribonema minus]
MADIADIQNLSKFDPFAESSSQERAGAGKVHVRVQQRSGRKCITTVEGMAEDLDLKRILKAMKKNFSCNGAIVKDKDEGEVIQLSGDQRTNINDFLYGMEICVPGQVVLHGF